MDDQGATATGASGTGAWNLVASDDGNPLYPQPWKNPLDAHADRVAWYLGEIPQDWANANLAAAGTQYCFTGMYRQAGAISGGPTLYHFPCAEPGDDNDVATEPLISYNPVYPHYTIPTDGGQGTPDFPDNTPRTQCRDAAWIDAENDLVAFSCRVGGPIWWYGQQHLYDDCNAHRNAVVKFHDYTSPVATLAVTLDGASETAVVIEEDILTEAPNLVPGPDGSNKVEIDRDDELVFNQFYTSFSGSTFTINSANYTAKVATAGNDVVLFCNITDEARGNDPGDPWLDYGSTTAPADYWDRCDSSKGYHSGNTSAPWQTQKIHFYDADDLADVANGLTNPWNIAPSYEIEVLPGVSGEAWGSCGEAGGIAWDGSYLYVVETSWNAERPIIHVYEFLGEGEPPEPEPGDSLGVSSDGVTDAGAEG